MFQFYLSSIKRPRLKFNTETFGLFQFYLSSIKRQVELDAVKPEKCFNSTLVQLKVGRIEKSGELIMFQFYLSSIKRTNPRQQGWRVY